MRRAHWSARIKRQPILLPDEGSDAIVITILAVALALLLVGLLVFQLRPLSPVARRSDQQVLPVHSAGRRAAGVSGAAAETK